MLAGKVYNSTWALMVSRKLGGWSIILKSGEQVAFSQLLLDGKRNYARIFPLYLQDT